MLRFFQSSGTAFFAGGLSLVSQIVGLQIVTRELSASELSVASVLVAALCGLSLGAFVSGRVADRKQHRNTFPLRLAIILLAAAAVAVLLLAIGGSELATRLGLLDFSEAMKAFGFSLLTILPINILLGGIVPVLTKASVLRQSDDVQRAFGWIYSLETFGAAVGSLVVTFLAIPQLGIHRSLMITAAIVLVWAVLGLLLKPRQTETGDASDASEPSREYETNAPSGLRWLLLVAALASSCASLGMELVWQRYFAVIFGSDSHSYAIVATMFLAGNSIGAFFVARLIRSKRASKTFYQWQLLLIGGSILLSVWALSFCFHVETLQSALAWLYDYPLVARLSLAAVVLLLPAILIGSALPVLVNLWSAGRASVGTRAGEIYACVIVGNVAGVLFCASYLIPTFGLRLTAIILAATCVVVSGGLFFMFAGGKRSIFSTLTAAVYWVLLVGIVGLAVHVAYSPIKPGLSDDGSWVVDHYVEKASHTLAVTHASDNVTNKRLIIDGVTIGESGGGVDEKQQVLAHLPFMIGSVKRPEVLTIGLGTGILAGELASNEQVKSLTCVELSSAVIEASQWFDKENRSVLKNQKLKLIHGDGVHYLRNANRSFDVIVSDGKSRPGAASNLPFFSAEYYRLCAESLSDQGVFVQWVSLRCDLDELKTILFTFSNKFPYGHVAIAAPDSIYLVGTRSAIDFDPATIEDYLQSDATQRLKAYSWKAADDFLAMYWLDDQVVAASLENVIPNTFDRPVLDRFAWKSFRHSLSRQPTQLAVLQELIQSDGSSMLNDVPLEDSKGREAMKRFGAGRLAAIELMKGESIRNARQENWLDEATIHFKKALQHLPKLNRQSHLVGDFRALANEARTEGDASKEFSSLINISELNASNAEEEYRMAKILESQRATAPALQHYYKAAKLSDKHPKYLIAFGEALLNQRKYAHAQKQFELAIENFSAVSPAQLIDPKLEPRAKLLNAIMLQKLGRGEANTESIDEILQAHPDLLEVYWRLAAP